MPSHPTFRLNQSAERVRQALVANELEPYYLPSGTLIVHSPGRLINWSMNSSGIVEGHIGYFRSRNYCGFKFSAQITDGGIYSDVYLKAEMKGWAILCLITAYCIGLALCVVGAIGPLLGHIFIFKGTSRFFGDVEMALKKWDESQISDRLPSRKPPPLSPEPPQ